MNTEISTHTLQIRPFRIAISDGEVADLDTRLALTRLPRPVPGDDWDYGVPNAWLSKTIDHWRTTFDWRAQEARINEFAQYQTEIDEQTIHFVHVPSVESDAKPVLLVHSYPGSFVEFLDLIGPLTDPVAHGGRAEDACSVVIPSVPGFGFSTPVVERGWTTARVAKTFDTLMRGLGYHGYGVHGSDQGANVARELGVLNPSGFLGLHVQQLFSFPSGDPAEFEDLTPEDYAGLAHMEWFQSVGGYNQMNASRPQTVAVGLSDSPAGQLAYNELFMAFGNGTSRVSIDQILTQVSLQWFTNTSATAAHYYYEDQRAGTEPAVNHAPTGVAVFADDFQTIRVFAERDNDNIVHWNALEGAGHYAALEAPQVLAADIRGFFAGLRTH